MTHKLKRRKSSAPRYRFHVELVTKDKTYYNEEIISGPDAFDDDDARDNLFEGAGVPDDLGQDDLVKMVLTIERLP